MQSDSTTFASLTQTSNSWVLSKFFIVGDREKMYIAALASVLFITSIHNPMNEIERKSYLEAMGVSVYYLKSPLAHGKKSPRYLLPALSTDELVSDTSPAPPASQQRGAPRVTKASSRAALQKLRADLQPVSKRDEFDRLKSDRQEESKATASPVTVDTAVQPPAELRFTLDYFVINGAVAIVDERPHAQVNSSDQSRLELLRNILAALNMDFSTCEFKAETIVWPLVADMEFEESPAKAAQQMLNGFITQKLRSHGFKQLIIFAGSTELLFEEYKEGVDPKITVTITASLSAMLNYPHLKRQVWQQLKPLTSNHH